MIEILSDEVERDQQQLHQEQLGEETGRGDPEQLVYREAAARKYSEWCLCHEMENSCSLLDYFVKKNNRSPI